MEKKIDKILAICNRLIGNIDDDDITDSFRDIRDIAIELKTDANLVYSGLELLKIVSGIKGGEAE